MGEDMGKGAQNYISRYVLLRYEYFNMAHTLAQLLWHSANKLSTYASGRVALQH